MPLCYVIRPSANDIGVDWIQSARGILREAKVKNANGTPRDITAEEVEQILKALDGVFSIPCKMKQSSSAADDGDQSFKFDKFSLTLRIARAVTVYKVQGESVGKVIVQLAGTEFPMNRPLRWVELGLWAVWVGTEIQAG